MVTAPSQRDSRLEEFFDASQRQIIFTAGHTQTLLDVIYKNYRRFVEPYALCYKVRKDGVGQEYLLVYDHQGGETPPGIKTFMARHVQALANTARVFKPRLPIELPPPGGFCAEVFFKGRKKRGEQEH